MGHWNMINWTIKSGHKSTAKLLHMKTLLLEHLAVFWKRICQSRFSSRRNSLTDWLTDARPFQTLITQVCPAVCHQEDLNKTFILHIMSRTCSCCPLGRKRARAWQRKLRASLITLKDVSQIESTVNRKRKSDPHHQWRKFYLCSLLE